jgi:NADPH:quinone reductase-like Zn-dependent oxidoreductase
VNAVRFHQFGGPEVLLYEDAAEPVPGNGQVLVRIHASGLNHLDLWVRSGQRERNISLPHIPGSDGAGVIAGVGAGVIGLKPGDRILISPGLSCGTCERCLSGRDNLCREYRVLGTRENGTYAQFVALPAVNVFPIPAGLSWTEAAAIPLVFLTAWHMLVTLAHLSKGETALIHGAGSGVGSAGIQIAKLLGARVITTAGSPEKLLRAQQLGADEIINYRLHDFTEELKRLTHKQGVDVVFEHMGGHVFEQSIPVLAKGGRLVTCGATTDYLAKLDLRYVYSRHLSILGSWMGGRPELAEVLRFFGNDVPTEKRLRPVIDTVIPLSEAPRAHRRMEERAHFGKIVLDHAL